MKSLSCLIFFKFVYYANISLSVNLPILIGTLKTLGFSDIFYGYLKGSTSSSVASSGESSAGSDASGNTDDGSMKRASGAPSGAPSAAAPSAGAGMDDKMLSFAKRRIDMSDKDKNGFLTPDEFKASGSMTFQDVDKNGDGRIDLQEYVQYRNAR